MSSFQIKYLFTEERQFKGGIEYGTGVNTAAKQSDELLSVQNNGKLLYTTGLNKQDISRNRLLTDEEKAKLTVEFDKDYQEIITAFREDQLDATNNDFWGKVGRITLDPSTDTRYYDSKQNPSCLLLKWGIIGGGYSAIAPTEAAARLLGLNYYLVSSDDQEVIETQKATSKLEVYERLSTFVKKASHAKLLWFAWALDPKTRGYTEANSKAVVIEQLTEYLDGTLVKGQAKKKCIANVNALLDIAQTNPEQLVFLGMFHAAVHYGLIYTNNGTYTTADRRTRLKASVEESIEVLKDGNLREELEELKKAVDANLKK